MSCYHNSHNCAFYCVVSYIPSLPTTLCALFASERDMAELQFHLILCACQRKLNTFFLFDVNAYFTFLWCRCCFEYLANDHMPGECVQVVSAPT